MNKRSFFIVGKHAVLGALKNPNRKILRVFLTEESKKNIYRENQNLLKDVTVEKVKAFEETFLQELRKNHKKLLSELKAGKISDKETEEIKKVAEKIAKSF